MGQFCHMTARDPACSPNTNWSTYAVAVGPSARWPLGWTAAMPYDESLKTRVAGGTAALAREVIPTFR
jgi:hypothetical protein